MIALGSLFSALATLNSGGLFPLAMKLLDLPAHRCLFADCGGSTPTGIAVPNAVPSHFAEELIKVAGRVAVSFTHLTLPTICSV